MTSISRKLGALIIFGVPAIVGGGIMYHFFPSYTAITIYEIILGFAALGVVSNLE